MRSTNAFLAGVLLMLVPLVATAEDTDAEETDLDWLVRHPEAWPGTTRLTRETFFNTQWEGNQQVRIGTEVKLVTLKPGAGTARAVVKYGGDSVTVPLEHTTLPLKAARIRRETVLPKARPPRVWKTRSGGTLEASFVKELYGTVFLRTVDGKLHSVQKSSLSPVDKQHLEYTESVVVCAMNHRDEPIEFTVANKEGEEIWKIRGLEPGTCEIKQLSKGDYEISFSHAVRLVDGHGRRTDPHREKELREPGQLEVKVQEVQSWGFVKKFGGLDIEIAIRAGRFPGVFDRELYDRYRDRIGKRLYDGDRIE